MWPRGNAKSNLDSSRRARGDQHRAPHQYAQPSPTPAPDESAASRSRVGVRYSSHKAIELLVGVVGVVGVVGGVVLSN